MSLKLVASAIPSSSGYVELLCDPQHATEKKCHGLLTAEYFSFFDFILLQWVAFYVFLTVQTDQGK